MADPEKKPVNPHADHRKRMRRRFLKDGFDSLAEHEKLELLLYYVYPRCDTNPIAHRLLDKFGSLSNVLEAPIKELETVGGVGEQCAVFLKLIPEISRAYQESKQELPRLYDYQAAGEYLCKKYVGRTTEALTVIALDSKEQIRFCETLYEGSIDTLPIYNKRIVAIAVQYDAASIILAHNHPSGRLIPSQQDIKSTRDVCKALNTIGVRLEDHFIIGNNEFVSFRHSGILKQILPEAE